MSPKRSLLITELLGNLPPPTAARCLCTSFPSQRCAQRTVTAAKADVQRHSPGAARSAPPGHVLQSAHSAVPRLGSARGPHRRTAAPRSPRYPPASRRAPCRCPPAAPAALRCAAPAPAPPLTAARGAAPPPPASLRPPPSPALASLSRRCPGGRAHRSQSAPPAEARGSDSAPRHGEARPGGCGRSPGRPSVTGWAQRRGGSRHGPNPAGSTRAGAAPLRLHVPWGGTPIPLTDGAVPTLQERRQLC